VSFGGGFTRTAMLFGSTPESSVWPACSGCSRPARSHATGAGRTFSWYAVRAPSQHGSLQTRGRSMGDKSPKSKNKDKKQQDAVKDKKSADMKAKQAAKSTK
jgi:hypothetical protein